MCAARLFERTSAAVSVPGQVMPIDKSHRQINVDQGEDPVYTRRVDPRRSTGFLTRCRASDARAAEPRAPEAAPRQGGPFLHACQHRKADGRTAVGQ